MNLTPDNVQDYISLSKFKMTEIIINETRELIHFFTEIRMSKPLPL